MTWSELAAWWLEELSTDDAYETIVTPLLLEVLRPQPGRAYLDLGSGEGRVMRALEAKGARAHGIELNPELAATAGRGSIVAELPGLPIRDNSVDGAMAVLVLEHLTDHAALFAEAARVTVPRGVMAVVSNHPAWTAPGSTPVTDSDGETLWRPGDYFSDGASEMPAGEGSVVFHHRSMATLLEAAADAGWSLRRMIERPHHDIEGQSGIPRLLACRWLLLP